MKKKKVKKCILVAPWITLDLETIKEEGEEPYIIAKDWLEVPLNWDKILTHINEITAIISDNDPYHLQVTEDTFREHGTKIIHEHNKGHINGEAGITELPSILNEF